MFWRALRPLPRLALAGTAFVAVGAAACFAPAPQTERTANPVACRRPPRSVRTSCDRELPGSLLDCVICDGSRGCIDVSLSVFCVGAAGCEDLRCVTSGEKGKRDDLVIIR